jgi:hypothetical protein
MILQRRKWMIGFGVSAAGTLVLLTTLVEALLSAWGTFNVAGERLVIQGLSGLLAIIGGFATMVAGTDDSSPCSVGERHHPQCDADIGLSAGSCEDCGHTLDD